MEICKPPTPRLKGLNKRNNCNTHDVQRDRECYPQFNKLTHNVHIN